MENPHKHHIVPIYKCIELGLTTSYKIGGKEFYFKENVVEVSLNQHALIHWGYKCNDLSPLLEVCNPPQWVIDMISLGDNRDMWAAQLLAEGEIDGIDMSGKNNPMYGKTHPEEARKKISESRKQFYIDNPDKKPFGEKNGMYGKKHIPENIEKFRKRANNLVNNNLLYYTDENGDRVRRSFKGENNPRYGATMTDETKINISEGNKKFYRDNPDKKRYGKDNPMYGLTGKNNPSYGRKNSEETRKKMSEQKIQFYIDNPDKKPVMTEEGKKRLSKNRSGQNNPMSRTNIERRAREKEEKQQGVGTLEKFL